MNIIDPRQKSFPRSGKPSFFYGNFSPRTYSETDILIHSLTQELIPQLRAGSSPSPRCQDRSGKGTVGCFQYTDVVFYDPGCKATMEGLRKGLP
jgi:hypothetical protein